MKMKTEAELRKISYSDFCSKIIPNTKPIKQLKERLVHLNEMGAVSFYTDYCNEENEDVEGYVKPGNDILYGWLNMFSADFVIAIGCVFHCWSLNFRGASVISMVQKRCGISRKEALDIFNEAKAMKSELLNSDERVAFMMKMEKQKYEYWKYVTAKYKEMDDEEQSSTSEETSEQNPEDSW